jgi:hypothetical protein
MLEQKKLINSVPIHFHSIADPLFLSCSCDNLLSSLARCKQVPAGIPQSRGTEDDFSCSLSAERADLILKKLHAESIPIVS